MLPVTISGMLFPTLDLHYIRQQFDATAPTVIEASHRSGSAAVDADHSPSMQQQAMQRLIELLQVIERHDRGDPSLNDQGIDLNELGDYAIQMLSDLSAAAASLQLDRESQQLEDLTLPMGLWISRHGGELRTLAPIVNALARLANTLREPETLSQLYQLTREVQHAVDEATCQDLEKTNPGRPWRLLLMNQAIIATRSHQTQLIDEAYHQLVEALPEEAPRFFEEGMQQMELLGYPPVVRQVVEKYYNLWSLPRTLH
jgi:hypothetical protein